MKIQELATKAIEIRKQLLIEGYKKVIEKTFEVTKGDLCVENIQLRLTVIDSLFSTNILKNHGALDELSKAIYEITDNNDQTMITKVVDYLENEPTEDKVLFNKKFGIKEKRALSLISKYCFFLTGEKFPISDKFVRKLVKKITSITEPTILDIKNTSQQLNISYSDFDVIAWVYGKISEDESLYGIQDNKVVRIEDKTEFNEFKNNIDDWIQQTQSS